MTMRLNTRTSFLLALLCVLVVAAMLVALPAWADDEEDWLLEEEWFDEDWEALNEQLMQSFAADDEIYFDPIQISIGGSHGLVLQANGTIWGWGYNGEGQLGTGTTESSPVPVQSISIPNVVEVVASYNNSFAIDSNGDLWAWGQNNGGSLGLGHGVMQLVPTKVEALDNVSDIVSGSSAAHALKSDGTLWSWGYQYIGNGAVNGNYEPVQILDDVKQVAISITTSSFSVALKNDGTVWVWGNFNDSASGLGGASTVLAPAQINQLSNIKQIAVGAFHMMALEEDGTLWSWGSNSNGQIGVASTVDTSIPVRVDIDAVIQIAATSRCSHVLKSDGTVWSWGNNYYGEYGNGSANNSSNYEPIQADISNVIEIMGSLYSLYYVKSDGAYWATGRNLYGVLGDLTTEDRTSPVLMFPGSTTTPPGTTNPTRIWIELAVGETVDLRATALPSELEISPAIWSSADAGIASVNSTGVVTGVAEGMTFVTVTTVDGQYSASIGILVRGEVENIEGMRLEIKLSVGMKTKLIATNANDQVTTDVIWTSSLPNVATVDADGRIEGISTGVTIITATTLGGDFVDSVYVRVL